MYILAHCVHNIQSSCVGQRLRSELEAQNYRIILETLVLSRPSTQYDRAIQQRHAGLARQCTQARPRLRRFSHFCRKALKATQGLEACNWPRGASKSSLRVSCHCRCSAHAFCCTPGALHAASLTAPHAGHAPHHWHATSFLEARFGLMLLFK